MVHFCFYIFDFKVVMSKAFMFCLGLLQITNVLLRSVKLLAIWTQCSYVDLLSSWGVETAILIGVLYAHIAGIVYFTIVFLSINCVTRVYNKYLAHGDFLELLWIVFPVFSIQCLAFRSIGLSYQRGLTPGLTCGEKQRVLSLRPQRLAAAKEKSLLYRSLLLEEINSLTSNLAEEPIPLKPRTPKVDKEFGRFIKANLNCFYDNENYKYVEFWKTADTYIKPTWLQRWTAVFAYPYRQDMYKNPKPLWEVRQECIYATTYHALFNDAKPEPVASPQEILVPKTPSTPCHSLTITTEKYGTETIDFSHIPEDPGNYYSPVMIEEGIKKGILVQQGSITEEEAKQILAIRHWCKRWAKYYGFSKPLIHYNKEKKVEYSPAFIKAAKEAAAAIKPEVGWFSWIYSCLPPLRCFTAIITYPLSRAYNYYFEFDSITIRCLKAEYLKSLNEMVLQVQKCHIDNVTPIHLRWSMPPVNVRVEASQWFWTFSYSNIPSWLKTFEINSFDQAPLNKVKCGLNYSIGDPNREGFESRCKIIWRQTKHLPKQEWDRAQTVTDRRLVLPAGVPIHITGSRTDVAHSFYIKSVDYKLDCIPGRLNQKGIQCNVPGLYYGECAELCGVHHSSIPINVQFVPQDIFYLWARANLGTDVLSSNNNNKYLKDLKDII